MQYFVYQDNTITPKEDVVFECKGSKFIALLFPLSTSSNNINTKDKDLDSCHLMRNEILAQLQSSHKKAAHFVWAFRIFNKYHQVIEGSSDDGEPKGSSGAPMLEVLRGKCLINVFCVCIRYFGGTKLGIGGLVRAYTQATLQAIAYAEGCGQFIPYQRQDITTIRAKSSAYNKILHLATQHKLRVVNREFLQSHITLQLQGSAKDLESFLQAYKNLYYDSNIS
ncbi:YigZ family protein [Helicobacter trogontum]|uniref:YigZ family protein n=1 Tax=Helicobacter trogontum TaxID=50960 RepID=A0A4U8TE68_9HELI|nr:YigZ family protein [Helicobacter trogontum]MDY5186083.1 YigZ family protein [Helicobacter trogontum]TLD98315.1 YigZ family protein [Helicobacter trogontum]